MLSSYLKMETTKVWYLENFSMMKVLKPEEMQRLDELAKMSYPKKHEVLYFPEDNSDTIFLLKKGKVKISRFSESGQEIIMALLGPGEVFGELALIGEKGEERKELAQVTDDAVICKVELSRFMELMRGNSDLNFEVTKLIGLRIKKIQTKLENLVFKTSEQRIVWFIKDMAERFGRPITGFPEQRDVNLKLTHEDIGKLTATSRQMVTTVFSKLEKDGLIKYDRRRIYVLDIDKLDY